MIYQTKKIKLEDFQTISGYTLLEPEVCYSTYGDIHTKKKVALFFHGFSSNSELHTWWEKFRFNKFIDFYNIICINSLGSSHGTVGPESCNPKTGLPYADTFPEITIQDTVNFTISVLKKLNISNVDLVFGCSLGGMQVLDMFLRFPKMGKKFISVAGVPVPYMTKMINLAQARLIDMASRKHDRGELENALGLSRFFFRLSCTTEEALETLYSKRIQKHNGQALEVLEAYFVEDNIKFQKQFSPYSNSLYMKMMSKFDLSCIYPVSKGELVPELILISIENDQFTPEKYVKDVFDNIRANGYHVMLRHFYTKFGHESWIVDGERFYEFIKENIYN